MYFDGAFRPARFYSREKLVPGDVIEGPALITEYTAATLVPPSCMASVDALGNFVIDIGEVS